MNVDELKSILNYKSNNFFRNVVDSKDTYYLHDTQINAAKDIVIQLASNITRSNHVMLVAKMQSGKTGVCNSVANIINLSKLSKPMHIKKYMFISGMNDCGLKNQTFDRVKRQVIGANEDNIYTSKRSKRNLSENKYFILKNSDLKDFNNPIDNSLIFIDESHYGSNESNVLTQFLVRNGIDWRDRNSLIERNIYIVSISATPFEEVISDTTNSKKIIELKTSDEYIGVSEFLNKDALYESNKDDVSVGGVIFDYIIDAHDRMKKNDEYGVILIRTRNFKVIEENQYIKDNFEIFEMYASGTNIEYDKLSDKMEELMLSNHYKQAYDMLGHKTNSKPLLVLIKGAFRAGITIKEEYKELIYMIYDHSTAADTTAQALLGRMCGYRHNASSSCNTKFYINKKYAQMYSKWEQNFNDKELVPCDKYSMEWIENGYKGDDVIFGSRPCGNFSIKLTDDEILELYTKCKGKRKIVSMVESILPSLFKKYNVCIDYDYIGEAHMKGKNNYAKTSQEKRFNSFSKESLVFQFRPDKIKKFMSDTNRDYLTKDDIGKKCISLVLDSEIIDKNGIVKINGNKRLLVYYVEVGQKKLVYSRSNQYKPFKDTNLN